MDIKAILKARNLSDENIESLMTNPAFSGVLEGFINEAEQGKTALMNAQEIENKLKTWNDTEVIPYVRKADQRVAEAEARIAQQAAYLKTLKDQGYEVPDSYLATPPPSADKVVPPTSSNIDSTYIDQRAMDIARTNMALVSMSNKYRQLTGQELDLESEYEDFGKNKRPSETLRDYVGRKYDMAGLETKRATEKREKELNEIRDAAKKEAIAEYQKVNGANGETRSPRPSKFDRIVTDDTRKSLWQTAQGRDQATRNRLEKYTSGTQQ